MEYIKNIEKPKIRRQPNLKGFSRYVFKEDTQIGKKHMERCSTLSAIVRGQMKIFTDFSETEKSAATLENSLAVLQKVK